MRYSEPLADADGPGGHHLVRLAELVLDARPSNRPVAGTCPPGWIEAAGPMTVTGSRRPRTFTRRTENPSRGRGNVTRPTFPASASRWAEPDRRAGRA